MNSKTTRILGYFFAVVVIAAISVLSIVWCKDYPAETVLVYQVIDPNFPDVSDNEINKILDEATNLISQKYQVNMVFKYKGKVGRDIYLENHNYPNKEWGFIGLDIDFDGNPAKEWVNLWDKTDFDLPAYQDVALNLVKKYPIKQLIEFFPTEKRGSLNSYENVASALLKEYRKAILRIRSCSYKGKSLLDTSDYSLFQSAKEWYYLRSFEVREDPSNYYVKRLPPNSIVLYNGPVLEDQIWAVHTMIKGVINGTWGFVSSFPTYVNPPCVQEIFGKVPDEQKHYVLAGILAHEIGHAFLKLDDVYGDDKKGCVMYLGAKASTLVARYELIKNKDACPEEVESAHIALSKKNKKSNVNEQKIK